MALNKIPRGLWLPSDIASNEECILKRIRLQNRGIIIAGWNVTKILEHKGGQVMYVEDDFASVEIINAKSELLNYGMTQCIIENSAEEEGADGDTKIKM